MLFPLRTGLYLSICIHVSISVHAYLHEFDLRLQVCGIVHFIYVCVYMNVCIFLSAHALVFVCVNVETEFYAFFILFT